MSTQNKDQEKSQDTYTPAPPEHVHGPNCNHHHHAVTPIVREMPKVGRNDECPCGSKQKFKKCCGK